MLCLFALTGAAPVTAQERPDPAATTAAQREAMSQLPALDGLWRGTARVEMRPGEEVTVTQTERVGPFLGGTIKVIEGRGFTEDGSMPFNALAILSFDPGSGSYSMRSYAQGRSGDFPVVVTDDGMEWTIEAGPMKIVYSAAIDGDTWTEVGDRIMPNGDTVRFFESTMTRIGDTDWPTGGAVAPE
jgi:hypothetical protein